MRHKKIGTPPVKKRARETSKHKKNVDEGHPKTPPEDPADDENKSLSPKDFDFAKKTKKKKRMRYKIIIWVMMLIYRIKLRINYMLE